MRPLPLYRTASDGKLARSGNEATFFERKGYRVVLDSAVQYHWNDFLD